MIIKGCPFCDGSSADVSVIKRPGGYACQCAHHDCMAIGPQAVTVNRAVEKWNDQRAVTEPYDYYDWA